MTLDAAHLLDAWDCGRNLAPTQRALLLTKLAAPDLDADAIAALPLGRRDQVLLTWRWRMFGANAAALTDCPACGEAIELNLPLAAMCAAAEESDAGVREHNAYGWRIAYRAPTSVDVVAVVNAGGDVRALIVQCIEAAEHQGRAVDATTLQRRLPRRALEAIARGMQGLDPGADIVMRLICPQCQHGWAAAVDVAAFLWNDLSGWARRMLRDVAALARGYGWREGDILAMSRQRREDYLALLEAS